MTNVERRNLLRTSLLGGFIIAIVLLLNAFGQLEPVNTFLYHKRAKIFQSFTPPPTKNLIHLDIDDASLELMGAFPWPRTYLAEVVDELNLAGAKAIATDILFPEAKAKRYAIKEDGSAGELIDDDQNFADALIRFGNALIPLSLDPRPPLGTSNNYDDVAYRMMIENLQLPADVLLKRLGDLKLFDETFDDDGPSIHARARRRAMYESIDLVTRENGIQDEESVRQQVLPNLDLNYSTVELRVFQNEYRRMRGLRALDHLVKPDSEGIDGLPPAYIEIPPIATFAEAAATTGFVNHTPSADGVIRSVPLWIKHRGRLYPQMGLALACQMLNVPIHDVIIKQNEVLIPIPGGSNIRIPTRKHYAPSIDAEYIGFMDIPFFGNDHWEFMYDYPQHTSMTAHIPLTLIWNVVLERHRLAENIQLFDDATELIYLKFAPEKLRGYREGLAPTSEMAPRLAIADEVIQLANDWLGFYLDTPADELEKTLKADGVRDDQIEITKRLVNTARILPNIKTGIINMADRLVQSREQLARTFNNKAVLLGWTATSSIADFVPTSLHPRCPGVVIHGAVFNGILTYNLLQQAPSSWVPVMTILFGLLAVIAVSAMAPWGAFIATLSLITGWIFLNGVLLYDYSNTTLEAGAPLTAIGGVWIVCTIFRSIIERIERTRITDRFNSYVDPGLVSYVLENPDRAHLEGSTKELSVVFTDLQGFTTLTEILKEKTVDLLNEYMGLMVPFIRSENQLQHRRGYVNKFLGDGIMFFFGAPRHNPHHAVDALQSAMQMQAAMPEFNKSLKERGLPSVYMRVGIASGNMVVGDAGPPDASDYTVLGDNVNLAARLESANKALGTFTMINERCMELLEGRYILRPLANLQVVGKQQGVMTYEPLDLVEDATETHKRYVVRTADMVDAYLDGRFTDCIEASKVLASEFTESKLIDLYRASCINFIANPPEDFNGHLVLTSK